ncbi:hypothetical protein ANN_08549 [Periplaneta americana]|uniref:Uncharacterized protein n=1 Tax=Periplaneta americana TaxID=6978 RepID=A0ABQ8T2D6_PERAM|nr:hypothetical protein ANN_08549 [Periplaneta americana]
MAGLCEGGNEPSGSLKAICKTAKTRGEKREELWEEFYAIDAMINRNDLDKVQSGIKKRDHSTSSSLHGYHHKFCKQKHFHNPRESFGLDIKRQRIYLTWSQATKGNIEGGESDPVLWIEFGVAQWSERLDLNSRNSNQSSVSYGRYRPIEYIVTATPGFERVSVGRLGVAARGASGCREGTGAVYYCDARGEAARASGTGREERDLDCSRVLSLDTRRTFQATSLWL